MRYFVGLVCVLALGVMGCSEGANDVCEGVVCEDTECRSGGLCDPSNGVCDFTPVADGTACGDDKGTCQQGSCQVACTEQGIRDAITAGVGPYTFDCNGPQTVVTKAEIVIDNDVILDGEGNLTIDGDRQHRVLSVSENVTAELLGLTMSRGNAGAAASGGGIDNGGTLTLMNSTVSGSSASSGGGIYNGGTLTLMNSTVSGNSAEGEAGGIFNSHGTLTLMNSTVSGNATEWSEHGGQALVNLRGVMTLVSSTVSGMIYAEGEPTPGVVATVVSAATLIRGQCGAPPPEFAQTEWVSDGYNVGSPGYQCGFDQPTDQVGVPAEELNLGPLANNGGDTMTHALGADSVAVDHIPAVDCEVDKDQRGQPRPETDGTMCDVGAFEVQP